MHSLFVSPVLPSTNSLKAFVLSTSSVFRSRSTSVTEMETLKIEILSITNHRYEYHKYEFLNCRTILSCTNQTKGVFSSAHSLWINLALARLRTACCAGKNRKCILWTGHWRSNSGWLHSCAARQEALVHWALMQYWQEALVHWALVHWQKH